MRKELQFLISIHLIILLFLLYQTFDLITLLNDDSFDDQLKSWELNQTNSNLQLIPKIIHQTYKDTSIPDKWLKGQQNCINLHKDYQYILWTDDMSREFISEEFPWFLSTWDDYKYPIERADAIRYFALSHFGGIYIDLDDGCEKKLDPLLKFPAFVRKTLPTGISNDVMGSIPNHPFFLKTIDNLQRYNWNYLIPYLTIMYSTGPLFLSVIWKQYKRFKSIPDLEKVRILFPGDYKLNNDSFFSITEGSSWHLDDAKFIKSLANHILLCVILGFSLAAIILYGEYKLYIWLINGNYKKIGFTKKISSFWKGNKIGKRNRKNSNLPHSEYIELNKV